jgi:hypothetical protein
MLGNGEFQGERRRRIQKESQALPLFMTAGKSRVSESVTMSASTSREMQRYLRWAAEAARIGRDEAQVMMLDRAIVDYLKKDDAWQAHKGAVGGNEAGDDAAGEAAMSAGGGRTSDAPRAPTPGAGPRVGGGQADGNAKPPGPEGGSAKAK